MQSIKLNLIPGSVLPVVNVSQYDVHRQFQLVVYEGAASYSLSGKSVEIRGTKPDGNGFAYDTQDGVVSVSGNTVTISTTQQMTAVGGQTMAELRIKSGTTILGTINFILDVEHSALSDDTPISETEIPVLERQLEELVEEIQVYTEDAEAWAVGERDGEPVPSSDPTYHNNAKYYASNALSSASTATTKAGEAATSATNASNSATAAGNAATTATTKAGEASTSATNAGNSATAAAADSLEAEGWAVGEQDGTPVGPTSPYYHNNAKYYSEQADVTSLASMSDVELTSPTNNQVLKYNATTQKWVNGTGGGGGADALDDLTDVDITSAADGDLLQYDATGQKWVNSAKIPQKVAGLQDQIDDIRSKLPQIYGVVWDGSADSECTRTNDAATFSDPQPYYAGMTGTPSSPFDNIQPWAGMVRGTDTNAGEVVAIPKFYYKLGYASGTTGIKLQIAPASNGAAWAADNGFKISPAHIDRGDGAGARDVVYVGRYHCASDYKSKTGVNPRVNITRTTARTGIHALGSNIWQGDYALRVTLWMLYLVEFADWNSQDKIGGGCTETTETSSNVFNMGYTDSMPYHTGTVSDSISRTVYGGTQYRNIEGLWDNCFDWVDGIRFDGTDVYGFLDPSQFSDASGGTLIGTRLSAGSSYISAWSLPSVTNYEWMMLPSAVNGSESTYVGDTYAYNAAGVTLRIGGDYYTQMQQRGLFCLIGSSPTAYYDPGIGSRLMILP